MKKQKRKSKGPATKTAIRRYAKGVGIKRVAKDVDASIQHATSSFIMSLMEDSALLMAHRGGKTLTRKDSELAIRIMKKI